MANIPERQSSPRKARASAGERPLDGYDPAPDAYTIVIPTLNRPALLQRAIDSALAQTIPPAEVLVVDDGSEPPAAPAPHPAVRVLRNSSAQGVAAARNLAIFEARSRWLTMLDDDDELRPEMAALSLEAIRDSALPPPVAALSAIEVCDEKGAPVYLRLPVTLAKGNYFNLEDTPRGRTTLTKQTLFVETEVLRRTGGWDEEFRARGTTELFLRLNPICSLQGFDAVTYVQYRHAGPRISTNSNNRQVYFELLVAKHQRLLESRPRGYARLLLAHAEKLKELGDGAGAAEARRRAVRMAPTLAVRRIVTSMARSMVQRNA